MDYSAAMRRCLELADRGRGAVGNGALVGSVLLRRGAIVAEGFHAAWGRAHAERALLEAFSSDVEPEDVLVVNLEPCCHHGKTPPCIDILLQRGVRRVVVGMADPDPRVAGKGIALLRSAGVAVEGPVLPELCYRANRGFVSVRTTGRPWITLKRAQTPDGRVANPDGSPLKITSSAQDVWAHTRLRATHDAILIGVGTALCDDPSLNTRFAQLLPQENAPIQPWRIVLDRELRLPPTAKLATDAHRARTIVVHAPEASADRASALAAAGADQRAGLKIEAHAVAPAPNTSG